MLVDALSLLKRAKLWGHVHFCAMKQLFNGQNLDAWIILAPTWRMIKASAGGFGQHIPAGLLQGEEHADSCIFSFHGSDQVADISRFYVARFHLHQRPLCLAGIVINKGHHAINALITAFLTSA